MNRKPLLSLSVLVLLLTACGGSSWKLDPAPDKNTPGEYGCNGCPDTAASNFTLQAASATRQDFSGTVSDAIGNGRFFVGGPNGQEIEGTIPTDPETGDFDFTVPLFCGEQLVKCLWSNDAGTYVLVTRVITTECIESDIRATLSWGDDGDDFELHLIKPGGRINDDATDCTWTSCVGTGPDWGVVGDSSDDPRKDVDDTGTFGPENIFLAKPESGTWNVMVEHWGDGALGARGSLILNVKGVATVIDSPAIPPKRVWKAATITWPEGVVTPNTEIFDCSGSWESGCTAQLP